MQTAIRCDSISKHFGALAALDGFDLSVGAGEIHGLLGPNGAGKSTAIRVLLGQLRHSGGSVRVLDRDPWDESVELHRHMAYVPDDVRLWPMLTGGEVIDLLGSLRGSLDEARRDELIERFRFDPTRKSGTYSHGNRQKVVLIAALAADVELLVLDEPTTGLDPLMTAEFRQCIREAQDRGTTVLLSSHVLADVEALCDRISIIRDGRLVETGTMQDLRHLARTSFTVQASGDLSALGGLAGIHDLELDAGGASFSVDPGALEPVLAVLAGASVGALTSTPPTLEELFLRHYDGSGGAA